jgi:hypothetical protein
MSRQDSSVHIGRADEIETLVEEPKQSLGAIGPHDMSQVNWVVTEFFRIASTWHQIDTASALVQKAAVIVAAER